MSTTYLVKEKMLGHAFMSKRGWFTASTDSLATEIATALEARGFVVQKQEDTEEAKDE